MNTNLDGDIFSVSGKIQGCPEKHLSRLSGVFGVFGVFGSSGLFGLFGVFCLK